MTMDRTIFIGTQLGTVRIIYSPRENLLEDIRFVEDDLSSPTAKSEGSLADLFSTLRLPEAKTAFQSAVRSAACAIPPGETRSYEELAAAAGNRKASRAAGQVMARNPFCLLVPCHRVVPKTGGVGSYRWGAERKAALLALEAGGKHAWEVL